MQSFKLLIGSTALFMLPLAMVSAQPSVPGIAQGNTGAGNTVGGFLNNIISFTNDVLIPFVIAIGFFLFVWGMFQYFILGGANDEAKEKGKSFMLYAFIGFLMIFIFWGVINLLGSFTGLQENDLDPNLLPKGAPII